MLAWLNAILSEVSGNLSVFWTLGILTAVCWYGLNLKNLLAYRNGLTSLEIAQAHSRRDPTAGFLARYRRWLTAALDWLDVHLGPAAWSTAAFVCCLRIAVFYPIASLLLVWAVSDVNTSGIPGLLADDARDIARVVAVLGVAMFAYGIRQVGTSSGWRLGAWWGVAGAGFLSFAVTEEVAIDGVGAFGVAFFSIGVAAGVGTAVVPGVGTVALVGGGGGALAVAVAVAYSVADSVAVAVAVAVIFAILYLSHFLSRDRSERARAKCALTVFGVLAALVASGAAVLGPVLTLGGEARPMSLGLLVFIGALPLLNAVFDWGSLGLTRHLLRRTLRADRFRRALKYGAMDAGAAVLILGALAVAVVAGLTCLNALAMAGGWPEPLIDVAGRLDRLREAPGDPSVWWIYLVLFSTLLPSVVHIVIALAALVTVQWPPAWNDWYERHLTLENLAFGPYRYKMAAYLTFRQAAEFGLPVAALIAVFALLTAYGIVIPQIAQGLLWLATTVAAAL